MRERKAFYSYIVPFCPSKNTFGALFKYDSLTNETHTRKALLNAFRQYKKTYMSIKKSSL